MLSLVYATPLCAMDIVVDRETAAEKDLAQGLALLSLGAKEAALECFFKVAQTGNDQERENALICIRNLIDNGGGNTSKDNEPKKGSLTAEIPNSNVLLGDDLDERLCRNEEEIKSIEAKIRTVSLQQENAQKDEKKWEQHLQAMRSRARQRRRGEHNTTVSDAEVKLNAVRQELGSARQARISAHAALEKLKIENLELLEKSGRTNDPRYQQMLRTQDCLAAEAKLRKDRLQVEAELRKIAEDDKKALYIVEAKYYVVDGRCCVTAGFVPHAQLEYAGLEEEHKRILFGQHKQEANLQYDYQRHRTVITSGFIPDSWQQHRDPKVLQKQFWLWSKAIVAKKSDDNKALAELRLEQARQAVQEKALVAQQANMFYFNALAGSTDQQGIDRLKAETDRASLVLQQARDEVERLTAQFLKLQ